jgi:hypothetical protein
MNARVHPSARASTPSLRSAWKRSFLALALLLAGCGQEADPASTPPTGSATHGATTRDGSRDTSDEPAAAASAPAAAEDLVRWSGRVVDAQGRPIGGAEVVLAEELRPWPHQDTRVLGQALSGADGDFLFAVREARDLVFEVRAPGFAPSRLSADPALHTHIVRLDPGFRVHGIVTLNYAPTPLAGARVSLEPGRSSAEPALLTTTDDEGRFEFVDVGASISGTARITVRHAPFRPAMLPGVPIGSPEPVRITVDPQPWAPLVGQVVRAGSGQPIVGATVRVHPGLGWNNRLSAPSEAMTDEQGRFRLQDPPLGPSLLVVEHPEMSAVARSITVGASADAQWIEMVRRSSVLVRAGGEAVEGTELVLISAGGERGRARVGADRVARFEGRFSAGPATLEVEGGVRIFQASSGRVITAVVEDGDATEIDVVLAAPSVLEGTVIDGAGAPVAGAILSTPRARFQPLDPGRWRAQTGEDGAFELSGLPVGSIDLTVEHPEHAPLTLAVETPEPGSRRSLDPIQLVETGLIRGFVRRGSSPLVGAAVLVGRDRDLLASTFSDESGAYELRVAPGRYRIFARYAGLPLQVSNEIVTVVAGETREDFDLDFPAGRRLRGAVVGARSVPVPDALVLVSGRGVSFSTTDSNGLFDLDVPDGEVDLQVFTPDFQASVREQVSGNEEEILLRLPWVAQGGIEGRIEGLLSESAGPPGQILLRVIPVEVREDWDENERRQREIQGMTLPLVGGRFSYDRVPVGRSRIQLVAPGYAPFERIVEIVRSESLDFGTVRLEPGLAVRGRVVDPDGQPIAGAFAHLGQATDFSQELARRTLTDQDGVFRLRGIAPGASSVVVYADGYLVGSREIRVPEDVFAAQPLPIVLQRAPEVTIRILEGGADVVGVRIVAVRWQGQLVGIQGTDADGRVRFAPDRSGSYEVEVFGYDPAPVARFDVVDGSAPIEVELEIGG